MLGDRSALWLLRFGLNYQKVLGKLYLDHLIKARFVNFIAIFNCDESSACSLCTYFVDQIAVDLVTSRTVSYARKGSGGIKKDESGR